MSALHLMQLKVDPPALMRFAQDQGLLRHEDEGHGYALHAWLAAMFGAAAPLTFRFLERRDELLGYVNGDASALVAHAKAFAQPAAWAALRPDSLATKPMPPAWSVGQRLQLDVLTCPVSRKDGHEKDIFLRALDRLGDDAPVRGEVYRGWFSHQWDGAVSFEHLELMGFGRRRLLRRSQPGGERAAREARTVERPFAEFRATVRIEDAMAFAGHLTRGIGRHRAFGFGMVLLSPPS